MYDHVTIGMSDRDASEAFHGVLRPSRAVTSGPHLGFAAPSREVVGASRASYLACADLLGCERWERPGRLGVTPGTGRGSLPVVHDDGPPTPRVASLARRLSRRGRRVARGRAGFEDNGPPKARLEYDADPDGHNTEAVHPAR